ncbi:uncharacterized protein LOC144706968 [Wolffia australiana]
MAPDGGPKSKNEIKEEERSAASCSEKDQIPLYVNSSQKTLPNEKVHWNSLLGSFKGFHVGNPGLAKLGSMARLSSPSAKFRHLAEEKEEISRSVASPTISRSPLQNLTSPERKVKWSSLKKLCKNWIRDPMNIALLAWIICVAVSGAILFMVMTGMLNAALPKKSQRDIWFEVNNQILNALFTLMCLYQHPRRFHHLALLVRFSPADVVTLRKLYCKNGTYKPNEWGHMMVVVGLLHLNCLAQYALCGLNLGYPRARRPAIGVGLTISVAIAAPVLATIYNMLSPLGKDYDTGPEEARQGRPSLLEKKYSFLSTKEEQQRTPPESNPKWKGGIFDLWDDISVAYLSIFCSFCVFGWNMDRLGFGNMYVHIATFLLLCVAPFLIFNLAAINIDNEVIRESLGLTGIFLCVLGLFYGGFWRIRMRKRFNLPGNGFCCGNASATDCFQWLCCCFCSLAQEVRTADFYEVVEDRLCLREEGEEGSVSGLSPLHREEGVRLFRSAPSSPYRGDVSPLSVFSMITSSSPSRVTDYQANGRPRTSTPVESRSPWHPAVPPVSQDMRRGAGEEC